MPNYRNNTQDYMRRNNGCGCSYSPAPVPIQRPIPPREEACPGAKNDPLEGMPVAMAYVPWQNWQCPYEAEKAFQRGTIFEVLDKPFRGIGGCCR